MLILRENDKYVDYIMQYKWEDVKMWFIHTKWMHHFVRKPIMSTFSINGILF